jgi:hypothetical protein
MRKFVLGRYAHQKILDWDLVMMTNVDFIKGLLEGHYLCDGSHKHDRKFSVYSASSELIYQLRTLYSMFNLYPRIGRNDLIQKNPKHHTMWYLEFFAAGRTFQDLIENSQTRVKQSRSILHAGHFVGKCTIVDHSDMIARDGGIRVHDIKVEEDSSFVAESIILHNCDFITSGDTYLQPNELEKLRDMVRSPTSKCGPQNGVWIWKDPIPGRKYVISSDVARGDAADYSTFHVIDYSECEVVVEFMGKYPPDKLADLLAEYGKMYNNAIICPEQNTFGYFTCVKLRDTGYPCLYYPNSTGDIFAYKASNPEDVPGFSTQQKTRNQILAKLEEVIRTDLLKTYSQRLYDQLQSFVWHGSKASASKDSHDDLVMSIAIGAWLTVSDGKTSEKDMAMAMAILKATTKTNTTINDLPGGINDVRPVFNAQQAVYGQNNPSRPKHNDNAYNAEVSDFSWLYK